MLSILIIKNIKKRDSRALLADQLRERFLGRREVASRLPRLERSVMAGEITATAAALELLDLFGG